MRKVIFFGCFIAVFLLLMIPSVNSIEYQQVENHIKYKIDQININIDVNELRTLNRLPRIEEIRNILNKIADTQDDICVSCLEDAINAECKALLVEFVGLILLVLIFTASLVGIFIAMTFLNEARSIYTRAEALNCLWVEIFSL